MATLCQRSAILILGLFCTKCSAECSITNEIFAPIRYKQDLVLGGQRRIHVQPCEHRKALLPSARVLSICPSTLCYGRIQVQVTTIIPSINTYFYLRGWVELVLQCTFIYGDGLNWFCNVQKGS